ncbi:hypothetical protein COW53_02725, partial [bacterium CG17_big_fil_post_rev_8_21_14_2_50_64_8]
MKREITICLLAMLVWGTASGATPTVAEDASGDFDYSKVELRAGIWLDKDSDEVYQRDERMSVGFQLNRDAYAVVYRIDTEGQVDLLWPRSRLDDGFVFAGHEYEVPVPGSAPLETGSLEGEGFVEVLASAYPFDLRELEIDFHGENRRDPFRYEVAGDPFLAMNEINYAVTGLEDTENLVVSNYASYYVHRKVDHPRYLCSQCHIDSDQGYEPYADNCTLDIEYDYGWYNRWYDDYGYYPIYSQPVYAYIDPWNRRPWVNFWYWPSYSCGPSLGYNWYSGSWVWCDSPYYRGDIYTYYNGGGRRYRPLTPGDGNRIARKSREYGRVSPLIQGDGPDARQRTAMTRRTPLARNDDLTRAPGAGGTRGSKDVRGSYGGEQLIARTGPVVTEPVGGETRPGLRIRQPGTMVSPGTTGRTRESYRHVSGSGTEKPALEPVGRGTRVRTPDRPAGARTPGSGATVRTPRQPAGTESRTIRPVEPRRRGTRIWNSGTTSPSRTRESTGRAAPNTQRSKTETKPAPRVAPRKQENGSRSSGGTEVRSRSNDSRATERSQPSRSKSSGSSSSDSSSRSKSSSGRKR